MDIQQAVVDQIVQNLAFDVEAVPKTKSIQDTCISQSKPLNVKIKVRKKDGIQEHQDVSWITDDTSKTKQKVRLVNSDRTIMTFDVFMEAEFEKKPRKLQKQIFDMLRPGICLGTVDDDKQPYMPSSSYSANITEPTKATKSDGTFKQTFTLSKNVYQDYSVSTQQEGSKWWFGKCKPGGCLDPPFSEDKYSYKPSTRSGPEREEEELLGEENVGSDVCSNKKPIILRDEETQSNERHSSIFDSGLFKKKRRSSDKSTNIKLTDKTDSIVDIYQRESVTNSASTRSNSIITYNPKTKSVSRMSDDKTVRSRGPSEDKPRKSFNDHSEPYFIPPKGINRIKEKDTLNPSDYSEHGSSDVTKLRHPGKESFKMPVPLPIPIPVPIPIMSMTRKPEDIDPNFDILATQGDIANVTELPKQESQEQELPEKMNLRGVATPQLLRKKSATGDIDDKPVEYSKTERFISSNVEKPTATNVLGDKSIDKSKLQPFEEIDSGNNMEETGLPNKNEKIKSMPMPLPIPIPVPVPFNLSDPAAAAVESETKNVILETSDMNLTQSKQSFETKTISPIIKDKHFEDSQEMQKNIGPEIRSVEKESTSNAAPKSQYSDTEADEIPKDYPRTTGGFYDQESDNVTKPPIKAETREKRDSNVEEITESNDKPTKRNDIKDEDTTATKDKEDSSNIYEIPDTNTQPLKDGPKKDERKDSQRISQSKPPILQKSKSLQSGNRISTTSAKDKIDTKQSDSPDKYLDKVRDKGTDLGYLSRSKTSTASAEDKIDTKQSDDSPDKYLDKVRDKGTDLGYLSRSKKSTASAEDKIDTKKSDSSDKYLDKDRDKGTDLGYLSRSKTSTASAGDKKDTKKSDSSDKYLDKDRDKGTDLGYLSRSKTSTASAEDKKDKRRSDSPDKYLDIARDRDTDLGVRKDEKRTSLPSGPKHETDSGDDKITEPLRDKEYVGEITKQNNGGNIDSTKGQARFPNDGNINLIAAPVIIDNTKPISKSGQVEEVDSETKILGEPMNIGREYDPSGIPFTTQIASSFRESDGDDETHSTVSRELIGTQSVIYDTDELIPSTSAQKHIEGIPSSSYKHVDTGLSSIQSTSTIKSAMKNDLIYVDLGFHSYLNDKNEKILRTFDAAISPTQMFNDSVTVLKTQMRISSNEIRIPVDSEHDLSIQINKSNANYRVSISESGFVNDIDDSRAKKQRSPVLSSDAEMRHPEAKVEERKDSTLESDATADHFIDYYEKELVPLQLIIKNLRNEIDVLATQQLVFKDKLFCSNNTLFAQNKSKLPRLVHSNKKCCGCIRK